MPDKQRESLSDDQFIRHRLYGGSESAGKRYAALVLAEPTLWALVRYELLVTLLGPIPGALGMILRKTFYPALFPHIGRGVVFGARVSIRHPERIRIGDKVVLDDDVLIDGRGAGEEGLVLGDRVIVNRGAAIQAKVGAITIGADTNVGAGTKIISQGPIRIAENVSIAGGSTIAGGRYVVDRTEDPADGKRRFTGGEIRIEAAVRIGMNALIQDGVTIGEGAIVAPASVVMTDVDAQTVVSGFPARPWRARKVKGDPGSAGADSAEGAAGAAGTPASSAEPHVASGEAPTSTGPSSGEGSGESSDEVAGRIRTYLEETRFAEFGEGELSDTDSLFDHDVLDSLGIVSLVAWLEESFDISVSDEDLLPENLESVARIVAFVRGRMSATRA